MILVGNKVDLARSRLVSTAGEGRERQGEKGGRGEREGDGEGGKGEKGRDLGRMGRERHSRERKGE